jgi:hypothetical protein
MIAYGVYISSNFLNSVSYYFVFLYLIEKTCIFPKKKALNKKTASVPKEMKLYLDPRNFDIICVKIKIKLMF